MKHILFVIFTLLSFCTHAQKVNWKGIESYVSETEAAFNKHYKPTKALLLGTFHFNYPNLDAHKIDSSKMMNVLSEQRQKEIRQLVNVLKVFNPTRIYVEVNEADQGWLDSLYGAYRQGKYKLGRNEIFQLGFRIAGELGHPKLYAVDDNTFLNSNYRKYSWIDSLWKVRTPVDSLRDKNWEAFYRAWYTKGDDKNLEATLLESFIAMADKKMIKRSHGHYLSAGFNTVGDQGPDALSMWWYNRNLRIFNNILKTRPTSEDRILIIFGSGHSPILQHLLETSPEFTSVDFVDIVKQAEKSGKL